MNTITPGSAPEPEYYSIEKLSEKLDVPRRTIEKWIFKKRLPYVKCGRLIRLNRVEIEKRLLNGMLLK